MPWFKRNGVKIFYKWIHSDLQTSKETVILVHAVGLDHHMWSFVVPFMKEKYNILLYDLRGHGSSDLGDECLDIHLLCDDLLLLTASLKIRRFHFIGQGVGGFIGIQLALQGEAQLQSLTLIGAPIHYPKQLGERITLERRQEVSEHSILPMAKQLIKKICYTLTAEKKKLLLNAYEKVSPSVYFQLFDVKFGDFDRQDLNKVNIPILILSGAEDPIFLPVLSSISMIINPRAKYFSVPQASYLVPLDQPEVVSQWIQGFIEKQKKETTTDLEYINRLTTEMNLELKDIIERQHGFSQPKYALEIEVMSHFSVKINGRKTVQGWNKRKAKEILAYLVMNPTTTREQLCDLLWPEVDLKKARNRLRVALSYLKQLLAPANQGTTNSTLLVMNRDYVFLQGNVRCDLLEYLELMNQASQTTEVSKKTEIYKQLLQQCTTGFLIGFYEEYFLQLREQVEKDWSDMAVFLAEQSEEHSDEQTALYYLEIAATFNHGYENLPSRYEKLKGYLAVE